MSVRLGILRRTQVDRRAERELGWRMALGIGNVNAESWELHYYLVVGSGLCCRVYQFLSIAPAVLLVNVGVRQ